MDKRIFGRDLAQAREKLGMNGYDLARELDISPTAVHKWENGASFPGPGKWKAIKDLTGIDPQDYRDYDKSMRMVTSLKPSDWGDIPAEILLAKWAQVQGIFKEPQKLSSPSFHILPKKVQLISWADVGNEGHNATKLQPEGSGIWIDSAITKSNHAFALTIENDSMNPEFAEGDIIVVDPDRETENGNYIIAKSGSESTLKQYVVDGSSEFLKPVNNRYPIRDMTGIEFRIVGVVIEKRKRYC